MLFLFAACLLVSTIETILILMYSFGERLNFRINFIYLLGL